MIFTVTVKSQQKRVARVDPCKRVILLLADSTEAPEKNMKHRDASYNNRMNGTCFTCEACAIDEIPTTPEVPHSGGEGCGLISGSYSCSCSNGYPAPTPTVGSGFWVGLQQTSFYTNVPSGGWVVAVACGSGAIVGSFPTTGSSYGYGAGSILGVSVMIYPAGVVYGAGYVPANETTFPILALTPTEGNAIVSSGFNITTGALGCPANQPNFFCPIGDSYGYVGYIVPCLSKFGGESGCPLFDEFRANADGVDAEEEYGFNMGGTTFGGGQTITGVVQFTNADGKQYCGAVNEGERVQTDALSGLCGVSMWPDTVTEFYAGCDECVAESDPIPCQYLTNLTNGIFDTEHGGYSSAGDLGFFGIGPANPPTISEGVIKETNFWEQFWGWDSVTGSTTHTRTENNDIGIIPPIQSLIGNCFCANTHNLYDGYAFVEKFKCCDALDGETELRPSAEAEGYVVIRTVTAGLGCGPVGECSTVGSLAASCSCDSRTASENGVLMGSPRSYEYVPCTLCPCGSETEPGVPPEQANIVSGIWWLGDDGDVMEPVSDPTSAPPAVGGICAQRCSNSIANRINCRNPCSSIILPSTTGGIGAPGTQLNSANFSLCTGFTNPQDFLNDPCARSMFFPATLSSCDLTYTDPDPDSTIPYVFVERITATDDSDECSCASGTELVNCPGMCHPDNEGCFLNFTHGPLSYASNKCTGIDLSALTRLVIPTTESVIIKNCGDDDIENERLKFIVVRNDLCEGSGEDPCGCCNTNIGTAGINLTGAVLCGGSCDPCCSGAGCFDTGANPCTISIIPGSDSKCTGGDGGGGGGGSGGGPGGGSG